MVIPNNTPDNYTFLLSQVEPTKLNGGTIKVVDSRTFKVSTTIAVAEITVEVGGMRYVLNSLSGDICETNQCQSNLQQRASRMYFCLGNLKPC